MNCRSRPAAATAHCDELQESRDEARSAPIRLQADLK